MEGSVFGPVYDIFATTAWSDWAKLRNPLFSSVCEPPPYHNSEASAKLRCDKKELTVLPAEMITAQRNIFGKPERKTSYT